MKNFYEINRTSSVKKRINFLPNVSGMVWEWFEMHTRKARVDSLSILSRQSDLDQVRAVSVGLSARVWKHVAMIFAVLVMSMANVGTAWAQTAIYASGYENGKGTWSGSGGLTVSEETTNTRTGSKAIKGDYTGSTSAKNLTQETGTTTTSSSSVYCHIIGWAKAETGSATTAQIGFNSSKKSSTTTLSSSAWTRLTYTGNSINATTVIIYKAGAKTGAYYDDIVAYTSSSNTIDLTKPSSATSASATTSSISWTNGSDTGTGATGIQNTLIFHRTGGSVGGNDLTLNDQGIYSLTATESPKVVGNWTLLSASVDAAAASYSGSFVAGDEYAIVHRDMAYNYSTPTYVTVAAAPACGETAQAALTLSPSSGTICGTGSTTFTVSGGSGTGALSVSSSDETKATASIDGSTVTVTGVAAGSATITVTKACDATYAEKTATYSATVAAIPTANAGADMTTEPGNGVALAATAAASGCTGAWTIESGPNTATSQLSSTSSETATFTPTVAGTYTLRWTVTNSTSGCSAYDEMTVSAAVCSISECGNATLTYPIYTSGDLTTSNLFSGATSSNATAVSVGSSPAFTGVTVSAATKGSSASAGACYAKGTALTGKMQYSASSKSSSYYIDIPFTVNTGYTFTPCDVQVVIQPVSSNQAFTVEITNGTNVYGTSTATLNAGVMEPIIGLTSPAEMSAGNYAIRLYPHGGSNKEFRMAANVILKGTTASAASSCTAPSSVTAAPTNANGWRYTIGETIDLTATKVGGTGTPQYQWQKYVGSAWTNINSATNASATTARLQISECTSSDGGSYRCGIKMGDACDWVYSDGYFIRVFTFNGNYSGSGFTENAIVWSDANTGVATVSLNASSIYEFKVYDNDGKIFGNGANNYIIQPVSWDCGTGNSYCRLFTGPAGNYTFTINISHAQDNSPYVNVQVDYPSVTHPSTGYMYITKWWDHCYVHYWEGTNNTLSPWGYDPEISSDRYVEICGTNYWYFPIIGTYNKFIAKNQAGDPTNSNTTGDQVSTDHGGKYITHDGSWGWHSFTTYTITYAANGGGGSMSATSGICPNASQAITSNAFTAPTGCASFDHWTANENVTVDGNTITAGDPIADGATIQNINSNITLTAVWKLATPTITDNGDNTFSISGSMAGSSYYYTTNGGTPTTSSSLYLSAVDFSAGEANITAKAIAHKTGYVDSDVASQACTYHESVAGCIDANSTNFGAGNKDGASSETLADGTVVAMNKCTNSASSVSIGDKITFTAPTGKAFETFSFVATCGSDGKTNYYKINGGSQQSLESSTTTSKRYTITIPASPNTTTIQIIKNGTTPAVTEFCYTYKDICTVVAAPTALTCSAQTSSSLTFTWTKASNANTYTAKLYSDSGCESQVASQDLGDVATVTFSTLSASTTYYCKVQSHGDGSTYCAAGGTTSAASGRTSAAAVLTAIEADVQYGGADIASVTLTGSDQNFTGLSSNTKFKTLGAENKAAFGKTVSQKSVTDDIDTKNFTEEIYVRAANNTSSTSDPTEGAIEFITPATNGILYFYLGNTNSGLTLKKHGVNNNVSLSGANYKKIDVTANTHYFIQGAGSNRTLYGIKYVSKYSVSITNTNLTKATGETGSGAAIKGKAYTATFTAPAGYTLPSDVTSLTIGGVAQTKGTGYTWTISDGTATLTVPATYVTGNIVVSVAGVAAVTHDVTFSLTNVVYSSGNNQGTGAATEGSAFSTVFAASSGYSLPGTITVTIGGVAQTAGTGYTWAQGSGTLTIPVAYVTGDIVVTIVGEEMEGDGCDELVHTEAATATTLNTTVGTATLSGPSSQTANDKAIKLNSSGYIELSPKAGKSFAAGDSLIIVMWNQASNAKTTGYRIAGTDYTASMPSKVNTTFRRKLIAADIVSSKVKIERESDNGSNAYFVSAIIKHCEDLPSCTTPALPTLTNQTVCPGSDIAAWNAEPTNIATITGASEDVAYSWKKKGSDTELAATASFDLGSSATEGMAGRYVVTVTVSKTGYISKSASAEVDLTVTAAVEEPSITANKAMVYPGNSVTLTATCGTAGVTWNWYLCANADGTGAGSSLGTDATYTIASAPAAGTYYYKAVATGSCGSAEHVYTLTVTAASECEIYYWFIYADDAANNSVVNNRDGFFSNISTGTGNTSTYTMTVDGTEMTGTKRLSTGAYKPKFTVPSGATATLYIYGKAASSDAGKHLVLKRTSDDEEVEVTSNTTVQGYTKEDIEPGEWTLSCGSSNWCYSFFAVKVCSASTCTDATPTIAAASNTVCVGSALSISATGYETSPTSIQWQKLYSSTSTWDNISGATEATYSVASAAAEHAGSYRCIVTKGCARTSNTVTIAVPSAPVFNSFSTTRRIMETQALAISDVSATDAVSYTWYKSSDATWDAGDAEIGDSRSLLKPYAGETAGSTYYVICRAANSCATTTSSAITVNVTAYVEEDCAIVGNSGEHNTFAKTSNVSSGTYGSITELHTSSNNTYIYYTAESGYYFATATVNACVGNASNLPTAAYSYSTDGGSNWTDLDLTGMTTAYEDHVINLPANVNAFRVGRRLGDCGTSSNTIYIHQVCFTYNENCTKTTVDPSSSSVSYTIGNLFSEPTFTVKHNNVAFDPQPTITYASSDEDIATVDDDGTVNFQDRAGTVVITASYSGDATYCSSDGSYTITVNCSDERPKIVADGSVNMSGCNNSVKMNTKMQNGTSDFSDGTYQWYRNGDAISGATSASYTAMQAGIYTVERTSVGGCVSPSSNKATITSESAEPAVVRLTPFQYYHLDSVYRETSIMRFRHLFAVKNSGTTPAGRHFKMELSRNGGSPTDVTTSNAFVMSADTVLIDLNKLYNKYALNDELVLTCKAVDCSGNISNIYKDSITIHVINKNTPTLALICSGADGDGTRKTSKLVVGGDFLTGYNKADLCVQTGKTSWDKTQEWVLYTRLKENYIVTPVNGYAEYNRLNYEPFDILFLTDYPKASKSDAAATILDDMADLCDYRPLFTFKTHMVHKSPSKWAAKGFMAEPEVPKQSRLRLNIVCYAHPMFDDLKEVSDHIQKDASDHSQIVYTMLTGPGHESSKGMQGFPIDAAEGFVTIGLVHYDATAADDTPSDGYVTWTSGSSDVMMVAAAERQVNLEARMILFSVNCGAQSKLTETGRQVVLKSLEYLLSDATIKPVADCSFTFTNGAGNSMSASEYASTCPACTGEKGDGKWSTAANWGPDWVLQPGKDTEVKIAAPVTVDMTHAKVRAVRILEGGSIDIPAGSGLEVTSTIRRLDGSENSPTEISDVTVGTSTTGNGTLILNNIGDTKATVWAYSKGYIDGEGVKNYQYIGTPFIELNALYNYYGSWIYSWGVKKNGNWGWVAVKNGGPMSAWTGYCITQEAPTYYETRGTLTATSTVDITIPAGNNMVVGNSWTAPIYIKEFTNDDFENLDGNVYFFNTGVDKKGTAGAAETRYAGSTYVTVPIHSSPYTGDSLISSMQGFFVKNTSGSDGTLHLDYDRHVRPANNRNILSGELHAPRREKTADTDEPIVVKIKVSGENYDDKLLLLAREDFSTGFDNGWDGDKWDGNESALYIYTKDNEGTENSVSAVPELEGTVIGFRAGEDEAYTLTFEYLNSDEPLYLYDTEQNTYTEIKTGITYRFFTSDKEKHERFIITRKSPQIATGVDSTDSSQKGRAKKLLIEDKMYILLNGMLYDATGKIVR